MTSVSLPHKISGTPTHTHGQQPLHRGPQPGERLCSPRLLLIKPARPCDTPLHHGLCHLQARRADPIPQPGTPWGHPAHTGCGRMLRQASRRQHPMHHGDRPVALPPRWGQRHDIVHIPRPPAPQAVACNIDIVQDKGPQDRPAWIPPHDPPGAVPAQATRSIL
jgi:hypothetical protein